jgi:hypothetical protein
LVHRQSTDRVLGQVRGQFLRADVGHPKVHADIYFDRTEVIKRYQANLQPGYSSRHL